MPKLQSVTKTQCAPCSVRGGHEITLELRGAVELQGLAAAAQNG